MIRESNVTTFTSVADKLHPYRKQPEQDAVPQEYERMRRILEQKEVLQTALIRRDNFDELAKLVVPQSSDDLIAQIEAGTFTMEMQHYLQIATLQKTQQQYGYLDTLPSADFLQEFDWQLQRISPYITEINKGDPSKASHIIILSHCGTLVPSASAALLSLKQFQKERENREERQEGLIEWFVEELVRDRDTGLMSLISLFCELAKEKNIQHAKIILSNHNRALIDINRFPHTALANGYQLAPYAHKRNTTIEKELSGNGHHGAHADEYIAELEERYGFGFETIWLDDPRRIFAHSNTATKLRAGLVEAQNYIVDSVRTAFNAGKLKGVYLPHSYDNLPNRTEISVLPSAGSSLPLYYVSNDQLRAYLDVFISNPAEVSELIRLAETGQPFTSGRMGGDNVYVAESHVSRLTYILKEVVAKQTQIPLLITELRKDQLNGLNNSRTQNRLQLEAFLEMSKLQS